MDRVTLVKSQWDRLTAVGTAIAAMVVLIVGWFGVSGTAYPAEQLPYVISAGLGSLFLLGVSTALWLSADLRDEWRKLDRIEHAIRATGWGGETSFTDARPVPVPAPVAAELTDRIPSGAAERA